MKTYPALEKCNCSRGAPMGRSNFYPSDRAAPVKLHLVKVRLDTGGYDSGSAYWGSSDSGSTLYRAVNPQTQPCTDFSGYWENTTYPEIFLRSRSREEAKTQIRRTLKNATFFN